LKLGGRVRDKILIENLVRLLSFTERYGMLRDSKETRTIRRAIQAPCKKRERSKKKGGATGGGSAPQVRLKTITTRHHTLSQPGGFRRSKIRLKGNRRYEGGRIHQSAGRKKKGGTSKEKKH